MAFKMTIAIMATASTISPRSPAITIEISRMITKVFELIKEAFHRGTGFRPIHCGHKFPVWQFSAKALMHIAAQFLSAPSRKGCKILCSSRSNPFLNSRFIVEY